MPEKKERTQRKSSRQLRRRGLPRTTRRDASEVRLWRVWPFGDEARLSRDPPARPTPDPNAGALPIGDAGPRRATAAPCGANATWLVKGTGHWQTPPQLLLIFRV